MNRQGHPSPRHTGPRLNPVEILNVPLNPRRLSRLIVDGKRPAPLEMNLSRGDLINGLSLLIAQPAQQGLLHREPPKLLQRDTPPTQTLKKGLGTIKKIKRAARLKALLPHKGQARQQLLPRVSQL